MPRTSGGGAQSEEDKNERGWTSEASLAKRDAALKVDGVSCYVLLSTLGGKPAPARAHTVARAHTYRALVHLGRFGGKLSIGRSFSLSRPDQMKEYNIKSHGRCTLDSDG